MFVYRSPSIVYSSARICGIKTINGKLALVISRASDRLRTATVPYPDVLCWERTERETRKRGLEIFPVFEILKFRKIKKPKYPQIRKKKDAEKFRVKIIKISL